MKKHNQKTIMNKQQLESELRRLVLPKIHGCSYEEALEKESKKKCTECGGYDFHCEDMERKKRRIYCYECKNSTKFHNYDEEINISDVIEYEPLPLTIDRIMYALNNGLSQLDVGSIRYRPYFPKSIQIEIEGKLIAIWQLLKNTKQPADETDQSKETLKALIKLFNNKLI